MPKYDLKGVQSLAHGYLHGNVSLIEFTAPRRSTQVIASIFQTDLTEAGRLIAEGLVILQPKDFVGSHMQWGEAVDVYGLERYLDQNWYIKFCLFDDDGQEKIESISFHPIESDLKLLDGRILRTTLNA